MSITAGRCLYLYYYIASVNNKQIRIIRRSDENEYNLVQRTNARMLELLSNNRRFAPLDRAFKRISEINAKLLLADPAVNKDDVSDAISGYLFSLRKYLDNIETNIVREHGKNSLHYQTFKAASSQAYDNFIEYSLLYQLRNADQHCGNIVSSIVTGIDEGGVHYVKAIAKSNTLLAIYTGWKEREAKLLKQQEEIDLFPSINRTHKCLMQIHQSVINNYCTKDLYEDCCTTIEKANEFYDDRLSLSFLVQNDELTKEFWLKPQKTLHTTSWMVPSCIKLIKLFLKNNHSVAVVLFHGDSPPSWVKECGIVIEGEQVDAIEIGKSVSIDTVMYVCYSVEYHLDKKQTFVIALNCKLPQKEQALQANRFMQYANVLNGKRLRRSH